MTSLSGPMPADAHLILNRTARSDVAAGKVPVMTAADGCYVTDAAGTRYLDLVAGGTRPVHLGYGRRDLARAAYDQMIAMPYFTPLGYANEPALTLAARLAELVPGDISRFMFECDGSEAVETAMKLARHHHFHSGRTGRFKVVSRHGAYHGVNGAGVRAMAAMPTLRQIMSPLAPGGVFIDPPYCYRCPLNLTHPACDLACAQRLRTTIEFEGPDLVSAFIGEPVMQGYGVLVPPEGYWPLIREICDAYGVLLIMDEVICGFGRTGRMFGLEHMDVAPDLVTMAKGLTGGYVPLGAVGCTAAVIEPVEMVEHIHTYANHPVGCATALKAIEIYRQEDLVARSDEMGAYFLDRLQALSRHPIVGQVRGIGLWTALDFTADKARRALLPPARLHSIVARARAAGLIIKAAPAGNALEFAPPLVITREEIDRALAILDACIAEEAGVMGL